MERITLFKNFWDLASKDTQDVFLQSMISKEEVKRRTNKNIETCKRTVSFLYYVKLPDDSLEVCKVAFCNIFGISPDRVRRLCKLLKDNKLPTDLRGRAPSTRAIPGETCRLIEEHIKSFPQKMSHYSQKIVYYLSSELTVKKMHQLFKIKFPQLNVNYWFYYKIFKERFSLRFGRPQVDTCVTCEALSVKIKSPCLNEVAKRSAIAELIVHKRRSKKFYSKLDEIRSLCRKDNTVVGLCVDFMMCLQLPDIPVQDIFYYRQLTVNLFCITNLKDNSCKLYIYHEGICRKGPNEVTSFIHDYISNYVSPNVKKLYLFSDGCAGQNKNHTLIRYCNALVETKRFNEVWQFYPVRGHSFLPCDRAFGVIKKEKKKFDRIYTVKQLVEIIANSSNNFLIKVVQREDIIDFKNWWRCFYKLSCLSDTSYGRSVKKQDKVKFKIAKVKQFEHNIEHVGKVLCQEYIGGLTEPDVFTIRIPKKSTINNKSISLPTTTAYSEDLPINIKKMNDLKKIMIYIPEECKDFYTEIYTWPTTDKETESSDREDDQ